MEAIIICVYLFRVVSILVTIKFDEVVILSVRLVPGGINIRIWIRVNSD